MPLEWIKQNKIKTILFIIAFLACCAVLFLPGVAFGHDFAYHITRIKAIADGFANGQLMQKVYPLLYNGYGYPSPLYYGDLLLMLPAFLSFLGVNLFVAYKLFIALLLAATFTTSYISSKFILKSETGAFVSSILYTASSYFAVNIYLRAAIGEAQAFVFLPLVLMGIYSILYCEKIKIWPLVLGFSGLVLSHPISFVIMLVYTAIILILFSVRLVKNKQKIIALLKATAITIAITAFFLFPFAEQLLRNKIFSDVINPNFSPADRAVRIRDLFINISKTPVMYPGVIFPGIGIIFLIVTVARIAFIIKQKKSNAFIDICAILGILSLFTATGLFPWRALTPYLYPIQFPWRLFSYAILFLALVAGKVASDFNASNALNAGICVLAVAIGLASFLPVSISAYKQAKINNLVYTNIGDCKFIDSNYLHANNKKEFFNPLSDKQIAEKNETEVVFTRQYAKLFANITQKTKKETSIELPLVYCVGYSAVNTQTKQRVNVAPSNDGLVQIIVPKGTKGKFEISYTGTPTQYISYIISMCSIAVICIIKIKSKVKKRIKV